LEIYDCTLREGEQAEGASFNFDDRIELVKRLDDFGVDYIELGWPVVSKDIFDSFKVALKKVKRAKIVAFGSTSINANVRADKNLNSIIDTNVKYACIFGKSCLEHVKVQLCISREDNLKKIEESVGFLVEKGLNVFYDAEHYFDGFKDNKKYAVETLNSAVKGGAKKIILCDTNGGCLPSEVEKIVKETRKNLDDMGFEKIDLGVHFHDDSGLALANTLISLDNINLVQGTINGTGERLGNLNFSEFLPIYVKKIGRKLNVKLKNLKEINEFAFRVAGLEVPYKRAFVGDSAFAHKGGVHINAILKGAGYEHESPEEFGNKSVILLNSLGGKSSIVELAKNFGFEIDKNDEEVLKKIDEMFMELRKLEEGGYRIGSLKAEQFLLMNKYFGTFDERLVKDFKLDLSHGSIENAFESVKKYLGDNVGNVRLDDFHLSMVARHGQENLIRSEVFLINGSEKFSTVGVDRNVVKSISEALKKGFEYYLQGNKFKNKER